MKEILTGWHTQDTVHTVGVKLANFSKAVPYRLLQQAIKAQDHLMLQALPPSQLSAANFMTTEMARKRPPEVKLHHLSAPGSSWHAQHEFVQTGMKSLFVLACTNFVES